MQTPITVELLRSAREGQEVSWRQFPDIAQGRVGADFLGAVYARYAMYWVEMSDVEPGRGFEGNSNVIWVGRRRRTPPTGG